MNYPRFSFRAKTNARRLAVIFLTAVTMLFLRMMDIEMDLAHNRFYSADLFPNETENFTYIASPYGARFPDCHGLFHNDSRELAEYAKKWTPPDRMSDAELVKLCSSCHDLRNQFIFPSSPYSDDEANFPHAYVILCHKDGDQLLRLLQALYWPQNVYCIHVDTKSDPQFQEFVKLLTSCFPNTFLSSRPVRVKWGSISVLDAALSCLHDLSRSDLDWKYVQIYSGTDFPLRTNAELVKIFRIFNGSNDSELSKAQRDRYVWRIGLMGSQKIKAGFRGVPPDHLALYKGSFQAALSKDFVQFMLTNRQSLNLYNWLNDTKIPDESYWSTIIHNSFLNAPGLFPGSCIDYYTELNMTKPWISRYQAWSVIESGPKTHLCWSRRWLHGSCIFGVDDLPVLKNRRELTAHKFYSGFQPATLRCLAELLYNRTYLGLSSAANFRFYENLPAVRYQRLADKSKFVCM